MRSCVASHPRTLSDSTEDAIDVDVPDIRINKSRRVRIDGNRSGAGAAVCEVAWLSPGCMRDRLTDLVTTRSQARSDGSGVCR